MSYIPHTQEEIKQMLATIGAKDVEALFASIPAQARSKTPLNIPKGLDEATLWTELLKLSMQNRTLSCSSSFLGAGAYRHYIPAAVSELASRSEFVTPYTPYQPEISQGTLQAIFEYQSMICRLFAMDVSNASHYSGATACADAALMARKIGKGRRKIIAIDSVHPEYRDVLSTYLCQDDDLITLASENGLVNRKSLASRLSNETAAVVVQFPNFFGIVEDLNDIAKLSHDSGALLIAVVPEPISLGILNPPGNWGADIAVGEGLSLGLPTSFGGPTLGIFTVRETLVRQMPGRVCGKTVDASGRAGYVLTLSTREQHIRREKATSNLCSNQALCATTAAIYLSLIGKEGLRELSTINAKLAHYAKAKLSQVPGVKSAFDAPYFNEFVLRLGKDPDDVLGKLAAQGIFGGVNLGKWYKNLADAILVCTTELNTKEEIDDFAGKLRDI